jgi:hypothetical protein
MQSLSQHTFFKPVGDGSPVDSLDNIRAYNWLNDEPTTEGEWPDF